MGAAAWRRPVFPCLFQVSFQRNDFCPLVSYLLSLWLSLREPHRACLWSSRGISVAAKWAFFPFSGLFFILFFRLPSSHLCVKWKRWKAKPPQAGRWEKEPEVAFQRDRGTWGLARAFLPEEQPSGWASGGEGCCARGKGAARAALPHQSPILQVPVLEAADTGRAGWGLCVFVMDFYLHFWPFCVLSHTVSPIIYFISKETGPSPLFFIVKIRRRQMPLDVSNLRSCLPQPFPTDVADKTMGCTDLAV